jgi:hypothetical protein
VPLDAEHVEDEQRDRDALAAVEDSLAELRPRRHLVFVPRNELAVQRQPFRENAQLRQPLGHVPAAPAEDAQAVVRVYERPEPVKLEFECPAVAGR